MIKREGQDPLQYTITRRNRQRVFGSRESDIVTTTNNNIQGYNTAGGYSPSRNSSGHSSPAGGDTDCSDEDYESAVSSSPDQTSMTPGIAFHNYSSIKLPPVAHTITIPTTVKQENDYVEGIQQNGLAPLTPVKLEVNLTPTKYGATQSSLESSPAGENVFGCFNMLVDVAIAQLHEIENKKILSYHDM